MKNKVRKLINYIKPLLKFQSLFATLIFNFKYLPLSQAKKLPIWLYRAEIQQIKRGGGSY